MKSENEICLNNTMHLESLRKEVIKELIIYDFKEPDLMILSLDYFKTISKYSQI